MSENTQDLKVSHYMSIYRVKKTMLAETDFTGGNIRIGDETFLELVSGKKRHKVRSLFNFQTNERFIIVK